MVSLTFGAAPFILTDSEKRRGILTGETLGEVLRLYFFERRTVRDIAAIFGVSHMTVYRAVTDKRIAAIM